jgi:hypothetical protein
LSGPDRRGEKERGREIARDRDRERQIDNERYSKRERKTGEMDNTDIFIYNKKHTDRDGGGQGKRERETRPVNNFL